MRTQLTKGLLRRVMYVENKSGLIDGLNARIGWVSFSKTGRTIYYRGRSLRIGKGIGGNFFDIESGEEYWISGVKGRGSNTHPGERNVQVEVDPDALEAYRSLRSQPAP